MELQKLKREELIKNLKQYKDEIDYMIRKTIDIETLKDDDLVELDGYLSNAWWKLIKLS